MFSAWHVSKFCAARRPCFSMANRTSPRRSMPGRPAPPRRGFTLTEILVATALTLLMMGMVVQIFAMVSDSVRETRGTVEVNDRLRAAASRLQLDLAGVTVNLSRTPPHRPEDGEGYFEYIEGPIGSVIPPTAAVFAGPTAGAPLVAASDVDEINNISLRPGADGVNDPDTTVGDIDDVIMFTTRSQNEPFIGKFAGEPVQSQVAEVAWFLRGTTLHRRVLLVLPDRQIQSPDDVSAGFYAGYDLSVRQFGGPNSRVPATARIVPNSLSDLTNRQNRYGHQPWAWPHDARFWGRLGLPTLRECTYHVVTVTNPNSATMTRSVGAYQWPFPLQNALTVFQNQAAANPGEPGPYALDAADRLIIPFWDRDTSGNIVTTAAGQFTRGTAAAPAGSPMPGMIIDFIPSIAGRQIDAWRRPHPWLQVDPITGGIKAFSSDPAPASAAIDGQSSRTIEDVVMTNVLSFDVKVWDPGAPIFLATDAGGNLLGENGEQIAASLTTGPFPPAIPASAAIVTPGDLAYTYQYSNAAVPPPTPAGAITSALHRLCTDIGTGSNIDNRWLAPIAAGAYVDLNYMCRVNDLTSAGFTAARIDYDEALALMSAGPQAGLGLLPTPQFHGAGAARSRLSGQAPTASNTTLTAAPAAVYDTGSTSYEQDGINQDGDTETDEGSDGVESSLYDGVDNDNDMTTDEADEAREVDDEYEQEAPPPYAFPIRGIQIKIRVFDPDSRQIREVTVIQNYAR